MARPKNAEVKLADLVMLQMVGSLEQFLKSFYSQNGHRQIIEEARESSTTPKLFEEIIQRSVEAQFGDRHAALRELVQNSLDSYEWDSAREVDVRFSEDRKGQKIVVDDRGKGMTPLGLMRDLLIPYNSGGKEFNPEKIGEHGIGWYSALSLARSVEVITKKAGSAPIVALVKKKKGTWVANLRNPSPEELVSPDSGTRIILNLAPNATTIDDVSDYMHLYAGHVPATNSVMLNGEKINTLNGFYETGGSARLKNRGLEGQLDVKFSLRRFSRYDERPSDFALRDKNPQQVIYTQNGLFVRFEQNPYASGSVHSAFFQGLSDAGIDFWVEIPANIRLTKGRNNVIADDEAVLYEAMYKAFEDTIIESVLSNEFILEKCSGTIDSVLAEIFEQKYSKLVANLERQKYSRLRRIASVGAPFLRASASVLETIVENSVKAATFVPLASKVYLPQIPKYGLSAGKFSLELLAASPRALAECLYWGYRGGELALRGIDMAIDYIFSHKKKIAKAGLHVAAAMSAAYLAYVNRDIALLAAEIAGGVAITGGGMALVTKAASRVFPEVAYFSAGLYNYFREISSRAHLPEGHKPWEGLEEGYSTVSSAVRDRFGKIKGGLENLVYRIASFENIRERREEKIKRETERIARKYISRFHMDEFTKRLKDKKVITGRFVRVTKDRASKSSSYWHPETGLFALKDMDSETARISIEELINLYSRGRVRVEKFSFFMKDGDFLLNLENPLSATIYRQLQEVQKRVETDYNPRVIEDYLNDAKHLVFDMGGAIFDLFRPSQWGKYHTWHDNVDRKDYSPSIVAKAASIFRWTVNHGLGAAKSAAVAVSSKETYSGIHFPKLEVPKTKREEKKRERKSLEQIIRNSASAAKNLGEFSFKAGYFSMKFGFGVGAVAASIPFILSHRIGQSARNIDYSGAVPAIGEKIKNLERRLPVSELGSKLWSYASSFWGSGADSYFLLSPHVKRMHGRDLNRIVKLSNLGWEYKHLYSMISSIESLISTASATPERQVIFFSSEWERYQNPVSSRNPYELTVDLNNHLLEVFILPDIRQAQYEESRYYALFEYLLHDKAHQVVGRNDHNRWEGLHTGKKGPYDDKIYGAKMRIMQQVLDYMESHDVSFDDLIAGNMPDGPLFRKRYTHPISKVGLAALQSMKPMQLQRVRENLEKGKEYAFTPSGYFSAQERFK